MLSRDLTIQSSGVTLQGTLLLPGQGGGWPLVVLCHGIPSGVQVEGDPGYGALARRFAENGVAAVYFNFRGTGLSGGDFSLPGWADDLDAVLDAARDGKEPFQACDGGRTALMGFSGGGAVSIVCAARREGLKGVAVLSSPSDFTRMMPRDGMTSFIVHAREIGIIRDAGFPPSEEDYYRQMVDFTPASKVASLAPIPLLIVHGEEDDVVPVEEAIRLYDAALEPKELFIIRGGGHKLRLDTEAMDKVVPWILKALA